MARRNRRLRSLERRYKGRRASEEQRAEVEEFNYLFNKYYRLDEYEEMMLLTEDLLDAIDEHGIDAEETLEVNQRATQAHDAWLEKARELERGE